jgi:hypothetical protein
MSKPLLKHYGRVVEGKRKYYNEHLHTQVINEMEGHEFEEVIKTRHRKVSKDTHGYYRGGILPTCMQSEMFAHVDNQDDIHDFFVGKYLTITKVIEVGGEYYEFKKAYSTGEISQEEMNEFIEKVQAWCFTHNITLLDPEQYFYDMYRKVKP